MNTIEGYASATSISPGETINFYLRSEPPHFFLNIRIYRLGNEGTVLWTVNTTAMPYPTPADAYERGCGWPAAYSLTIPGDWQSGVYIAHIESFLGPLPLGASTDILFVVRASAPGTNSKILFQLAVNTYHAYNNWGGKSLYGYNSTDDNGDGIGDESNKVSFDRPGLLTSDSAFWAYEHPFVSWLEDNGFEVEYGTSIDLHANPDFLNNYQLMISVGHDEYWSKEMRDNVEAFIANGGNVAFFSGNVCWWQVRFEDNNRIMVCYKSAEEDTGVDDSRVTVNWKDPPVNRPENSLTGVSFYNGAGWWNGDVGPRPAVNFVVRFARHWVFATTGLGDGDGFGSENLIVGYEVDAALFQENENGVPIVTGEDGTPLNFIVLATADCTDWGPGGWSGPDGQGRATMGIYRRRGTVFTAATTDWSHGLTGDWNAVSQITQNILRRLSCPCPPAPAIANSGFENWTAAGLPEQWNLEGVGSVRPEQDSLRNGEILVVDASAGETWISQEFDCEGRNYYRVGCWAKADQKGATIRLQSTTTWRDFAIAEHTGSGEWQYLSAVGMLDDEGPLYAARIKIQIANGVMGSFDDVTVDAL